MTTSDDLLHALAIASPAQKKEAWLVLRGLARAVDMSTTAPRPEAYLTRKGLALELGVSPWTIWRWQAPSHNLRGRRRYLRSQVEAYLSSPEFQRRLAALRAERRSSKQGPRIEVAATRRTGHSDDPSRQPVFS